MRNAEEIKKLAFAAKEKKALYGNDIDLGSFEQSAPDHAYVESLADISGLNSDRLAMAGVDVDTSERAGSFMQLDGSVIHAQALENGIEILGTAEALKKYDWLRDYYWEAVKPDQDKYTADVALNKFDGYFMRAMSGSKAIYPLQACMYIREPRFVQRVHNIIIAEENSELHVIAGCASEHEIEAGLHLGVTEFYIKKNAKLTFTMVHNWQENMEVRPRSASIVEENGLFISNYVCMEPLKSLQMYPVAVLKGQNATVRLNSILVALQGIEMDVGGKVIMNAEGSKAEIISRAITKGGTIMARGHLIGAAEKVKAHLECRGLILSERGTIHAVPELEGHVGDVEMSHEAAVGKIAQEEIEYLMARGFTEEEATSIIVRGFLNVKIDGLPKQLQEEIDKMVEISQEKAL